jgi:hypothetical protein
MAQDTILEMLHRPRRVDLLRGTDQSLPPFSEEEQALMNAMAEREQAETRARRTAERPGISDAAWRAAYGVADVVDPAIGSLADLAIGATVGADPFSRTQPIWEQRPSMQEVGELAATMSPLKAIAPFALYLREVRRSVNAATRSLSSQKRLLRELRGELNDLDPDYKEGFERLIESDPRLMSKVKHKNLSLDRIFPDKKSVEKALNLSNEGDAAQIIEDNIKYGDDSLRRWSEGQGDIE